MRSDLLFLFPLEGQCCESETNFKFMIFTERSEITDIFLFLLEATMDLHGLDLPPEKSAAETTATRVSRTPFSSLAATPTPCFPRLLPAIMNSGGLLEPGHFCLSDIELL